MNPRKAKKTAIKRRQYYIKKDFQTRFIIKFVLILLGGALLTVGLTYLNTRGTLTAVYTNSKLTILNTSLAIMPSVVFTTIITTLALGLVVIVVTLLVSHKIAGPMFRFEKDISRIAGGDLKSRIRIRKGDQFQEMATALNGMIDALAGHLHYLRDQSRTLAEKEGLPEAVKEDAVRIHSEIEQRFKL